VHPDVKSRNYKSSWPLESTSRGNTSTRYQLFSAPSKQSDFHDREIHQLPVPIPVSFGYSAHVATDLTVHPVLAASGLSYATNPTGHRYCELNQDAYIFRKINGEDTGDIRYIENCGLSSCRDPNADDKLHPAIRELWLHCLSKVSLSDVHIKNGSIGPTSEPTPDVWFHDYTKRVGEFVEQGGGFVLFFRDILESKGVCLPESG
jgi:hypothetical protein